MFSPFLHFLSSLQATMQCSIIKHHLSPLQLLAFHLPSKASCKLSLPSITPNSFSRPFARKISQINQLLQFPLLPHILEPSCLKLEHGGETRGRIVVKASAAASDGAADASASSKSFVVEEQQQSESGMSDLLSTVQLGSLFGLWYLFNIYFNIYNKQVLKVFQFPITVTQSQFTVGSIIVLVMWTLGLYKRPSVTRSQLLAILPLACVHTLGNLFTNMSLGKVAVSFTHTIKAMEPFFSVLLSAIFLKEFPSLLVVLSLFPIVGGVALASLTEASFNWAGFLSAMASNVTFQSRNVLSKKLMLKKEGSLDNINLFSIITIMSFFLLVPFTLAVDGIKFTPAYMQSVGLDVKVVAIRALLAAICFHSYQQVSYLILQQVTPVTHSVGNCVKRVVVIITSVLFFRTPVSTINALGTGIALAGVFGYSRVKQIKKTPEKKV